MANPLVISVPTGSWLKVATGVVAGFVHILKFDSMYRMTYRETTDPAPTATEEGVEMPRPGGCISSTVLIDVYLHCTSKAGKVRVDV